MRSPPTLIQSLTVLIENRNGLVVDTELMHCSGTAERDAARMMIGSLEGLCQEGANSVMLYER